jgi:hypothetical protein
MQRVLGGRSGRALRGLLGRRCWCGRLGWPLLRRQGARFLHARSFSELAQHAAQGGELLLREILEREANLDAPVRLGLRSDAHDAAVEAVRRTLWGGQVDAG